MRAVHIFPLFPSVSSDVGSNNVLMVLITGELRQR